MGMNAAAGYVKVWVGYNLLVALTKDFSGGLGIKESHNDPCVLPL
jgi:hypothetical protein